MDSRSKERYSKKNKKMTKMKNKILRILQNSKRYRVSIIKEDHQ